MSHKLFRSFFVLVFVIGLLAIQAPQPVRAIRSQNFATQETSGPSTLYLVQESSPGNPNNDILLKFESGILSTVGNIGFGDVRGLAYDATTDTLYGVSRYSLRLITIDRTTGVGTPVSDNPYLPLDSNTSEISVDSAGTILGLGHSDSQCCVDTLLNVDKGTGIALPLRTFGDMAGLAISQTSGTIYGTTFDGQLYKIDQSGTFTTLLGQITNSNGGVARIAFDQASGTLYGITTNQQLVTVDLSTLVATEVAQFSTWDQIYSLDFVSSVAQGTTVTIDWTTYPDGSPIPNDTEIINQFQSLGLVFLSPPGPPRVLDAFGGILISGGPTGFFGETHMSFVDVGSGLPNSITVEIIGSGLNISASLEAFDLDGDSLGIVTHTYTGPTGQLSPFTFSAPAGKRIARAIYNGGLNSGAAASIGTLIIHSDAIPSLSVLDDFNRADGPIGENWTRYTSKYLISSNQLRVRSSGSNTDIYWHEEFGPDQEAFFTFTQINETAAEQDLLLKAQSNQTWGDGVLEVLYDAPGHDVQVWTWEWPQGWVKYGDDIPVTFVVGDTFKARAKPDGIVEVYRNGELLGMRDVTGWSHYAESGYIGLWFIGAKNTVIDDFGGGTVPNGAEP